MLSHYNVASNIEQLGQVFGFRSRDRMLGVLPFFHSFGFTGTLMLPGALGLGVAYHANPLDAKTIGPLVLDQQVSFLLATPTFLQIYLRGCSPEQFGSSAPRRGRRGKTSRPTRYRIRRSIRHSPV
jgi:acyl-[acyl-carrier-protein]-phospholipid O-acyltransferase / long-chain-fatty-acid--[acyl-carrier-protein] ligase